MARSFDVLAFRANVAGDLAQLHGVGARLRIVGADANREHAVFDGGEARLRIGPTPPSSFSTSGRAIGYCHAEINVIPWGPWRPPQSVNSNGSPVTHAQPPAGSSSGAGLGCSPPSHASTTARYEKLLTKAFSSADVMVARCAPAATARSLAACQSVPLGDVTTW